MRVIRSPYRRVWMIGRTLSTGTPGDLRRAHRKQLQYRLSPSPRLSSHRPGKPTQGAAADRRPGPAATSSDRALAQNPPPKRDRPLLRRLRAIGVGPGLRPVEGGPVRRRAERAQGGRRGRGRDAAGALAHAGRRERRSPTAAGSRSTPPSALWDRLRAARARRDPRAGGQHPGGGDLPDRARGLGGQAAGRRQQLPARLRQAAPGARVLVADALRRGRFLVPNAANRYALGNFHPPLRAAQRRVDRRGGLSTTSPTEQGVNWLPAPAGSSGSTCASTGPRRSTGPGSRRRGAAAVKPLFLRDPTSRGRGSGAPWRGRELLAAYGSQRRPSTLGESVEQALRFGWIDGSSQPRHEATRTVHAAQAAQHRSASTVKVEQLSQRA